MALLAACGSAQGQAASPAPAASQAAPSEAARRQAEGPYRFILLNSAAKPQPKRAPQAAKDAPGAAASRQAKADAAAEPVATPPLPEVKLSPAPQPAAGGAVAADAPASAPVAGNAAPPEATAAAPAPLTPPVETLNVAAPPAAPAAAEPEEVVLIPIVRDPPVIPPAVQREARKGTVTVQFTVLPDGSVADAKAVATTERAFNRPVLAAVSKWKFAPIKSEQLVQVDIAINLDADK